MQTASLNGRASSLKGISVEIEMSFFFFIRASVIIASEKVFTFYF